MDGGEYITKDLVLVGGGHSHVAVLRSFGMRPMPGVRMTLIARDVHTPYSGMLPGLIAGHYGFDDVHIDLGPLATFARARLIHAEATGLDLEQRRVLLDGRPPVAYDVLSLDIGSVPCLQDVPGAAAHTIPVKPIDRFWIRWEALARRIRAHSGPFVLAMVGGGAAGVEVLLAARHRLMGEGVSADRLALHLFTDTAAVLPTHNRRVRRIFERALEEAGVHVHHGRRVIAVEADRIVAEGGSSVAVDAVLWATQAGAAPWLRGTGLDLDDGGFVRVAPSLQAIGRPQVFAVGDVSAVDGHPRPKAGVFAVRQGPPLTRNLRRVLSGVPPRAFRPQHAFLSLISTGRQHAVASRGPLALRGDWAWRWKDRIDRRFMDRYRDFPEMAPQAGADQQDDAAMRCGGCGAKVGAEILERALARLGATDVPGIDVGLAAPDDGAVLAVPPGKQLVQSVDGFRAMVGDPYIFGRIAANHAMGDLYAMGAAPWCALAAVTLPHGPRDKTEELLAQAMAGVVAVLDRDGATLVGGHTAEGAELTLSLTVNGLVEPGDVRRKGGLRPGDALILTKPLGTGTLFAADMRGRAKGRWIAAALASMDRSSRDAAACLRHHGAVACTDVTGFGLLGHLVEMLKASSVSAAVDLARLPVLDGALEILAAGIASTIEPENRRFTRYLEGGGGEDDPRLRLLFDPQTAGGLLAGVPEAVAEDCVTELRLDRLGAAVVGHVETATDGPRVRLVSR